MWTKSNSLHHTLRTAVTHLQEKSKQATATNQEGTMNNITIVGNIGKDPEMRFTQAGKAVVSFSVGTTHLKGADKEKETTWHDCIAFGTEGENIAASCPKGTRVVVVGRLEKTSHEKDGKKNYRVQVVANEVAVSIKYDVATIDKGGQPAQGQVQYGTEEPF
jgi:single-strand DNA-binding protein